MGKFGAHLHRENLDQSVSQTLPGPSPTDRAHLGDGCWWRDPPAAGKGVCSGGQRAGKRGDDVAEAEAVEWDGERRASRIRVLSVAG